MQYKFVHPRLGRRQTVDQPGSGKPTPKFMKKKCDFVPANGLFITGTDTGVGKTVVTGAVARILARAGRAVGVFKPIATGCRRRREGLVSQDAEFLSWCADSRCLLEQVNPVRYREPLSPYAAVLRTKNPIDWQEIQLSYSNIVRENEFILVEGIGGVYVPLETDYYVLDLMADMALAVVVVARATLGTINHTLLTVRACQNRGLRVAGIVLNGYDPDKADLAQETNAQILNELSGVGILTVIPCDTNTCVEKSRLGANVLGAAALVDWPALIGLGRRTNTKNKNIK
jgi:dethiobiotin synthetase